MFIKCFFNCKIFLKKNQKKVDIVTQMSYNNNVKEVYFFGFNVTQMDTKIKSFYEEGKNETKRSIKNIK